MLSSLFSSVLSKVLRKYFKGFESRNIKFSLSGEVDLLDLELEETALDDLHLPLKIKQGYVGKLQLIVPWQNLGEHSTIVRVSDVLIVLGPKSFEEYTDESEKVHKRKATQSRLNAFTSFLTKRRKHVAQDDEKPHSHDSFIKRLISTITNNLQLYVDNIHIRYEDDLTNPLRPFSIGVTLEHFAIESADGTWRPIVGRTEDEIVHKLFTLKHMAVYWDSYNSFINASNVMELKAKMYSSIYSTINKAKHNFILEPLSAEIKLVWNREDMLKKDIPKSAGKLLVDKFALNLREDQYKDLILLLSRITAWGQGKKFHKLRPTVPVREAPAKWWDYATNAVLDQYREKRKKWSWTYIKQRQDDKRIYSKIWRRVKLGVSLSGTEEDQLTQIEDRYSYEDILYFRTLAELYLKREEQEKGRKQLVEEENGADGDKQNSLFSWMGGWVKSKFVGKKTEQAAPHLVDTESDKLNEDEWQTLYKSLNYNEDLHDIDTFKAPQSIEFTMNALIINTSIMLRTQLGEPLMGCLLESFQFSTEVKDKWITLKAELADLQAHDYFTPNTRFKNIIFTNNEVKKIFSMQFDINPANMNADFALDISSNPINIVANAQLIKRMMTFFVDPLSDTAVDFSSNTPSMPKASVLNTMLMYKKRVYLNIDIQAPNIMVPENPASDLSAMLVFVLGRLFISTKQAAVSSMTSGLTDTTDPTKQSNMAGYKKQDPNDFTSMVYESNEPYTGANATEGESAASWIKSYYDTYNIALTSVQAWVTDVSQRDSVIRQASRNEISAQHILEPFNLNLAVRSCKVNIGSLTNIIFEGSTPEINLLASSVQIRALKHIVLGFMSDMSSSSTGVKKTRKLVGKDVFSQAVLDVLDKNRPDNATGSGILLEGRFFVPSISILLKRPVATEGNIIKITLERFGLKCRQTEREFVANGSLKDLIVEDLMQKFGDQYRYLATSSRTAQKLNLMDKVDDEEDSQAGDKDKAEHESRPKEGPSFVFNNVNFNNVEEYHYEAKIDEEIDEKNELIVLRFRNIAETSPAYQNIDNMLDVTFNSLSLIINRKTIAYLLNEVSFITYEHQEKQKKREEKDKKETTGSLSAVAREVDIDKVDHDNLDITSNEGSLAMTKPYKEIVNTAEEDDVAHRLFENRITFRVGIQIKTINVLLNDHAKAMGVIQMRGMNTLMKIQNNGIFMHAVLERARVKDMTGPAKFRNIVDVRGDNVMEMDFAIAPCIEFPEVEQEYRVGMKMNSLRMIYVERFVEELASFFGVFQNLFEAAAVAVAERLEQIYKDDTKMLRFYVEMNAPMIIVPASACTSRKEAKCSAGEALILQIGEVVVQNAFIKSYTMFEEISIRVQNVTMTTGKFKQREIKARDEPAEKGPLILKGLNASIDVERPINPIAIRTYGTAVKATVAIPEAKLAITPEQISTLLDVWNDNILFMPSPELIRAQRKNAEVQRNQDKLLSKRLSEVELFEWNSLILNLEIKKMQFQIYDYQTAPEVSPEALVKLKAKGFEVNVTAASYGMTKIDLHLLTLKAEDTMKRRGDVEVVPEFREFLVPLENKKQEPSEYAQFLSGTIIMHANQHQDINLVLDGFRIIPIPELIFSIINILMPIINKLYKVLDRRTKILDLLNPIQSQIELRRDPEKKHEKDEKERQRIAAGVAMQLTLSRAQISLVENMGDASSRGFVLNTNAVLDIAVYNYQTRIAVNTKGTEMFKCQVIKAGQGISIIEPFDIATDVTSGPQFIDVSTSLKTVRIVLSYSDIKVGANIANQWMAAMPLMQTATPYSQTFEESKEAISSAKDKLNKAMEKRDIKGMLELSSDSEEYSDEQLNDQRRKKKMARLQEKHLDMEAKKTLDLIDQRVAKADETVKIRQSRQAKSSGLQDPSDVRIAKSVARKKERQGVAQSNGKNEPVVIQATNVHDNPFERDFEGGENDHLKGSIDLEEDEQVKTLMSIGRSRESRNSEDESSSYGESKEDKKAIEAEREEQEREIITLQSTTPKSTQKIVLPPYRLEILLLDDVRGYDRPLARLLVDEFTSEIVMTQNTTSFLAWTRLSGSYYNSINSAWEPFLEPWKVQAKLGGTTVQVWSTDVMNLNMTGPLLNTMKNTMEEWMEDWKSTVGNDRPSAQPVNDLDEAAQINKKYQGKDTENAVNYQNQVNPYDITDQDMRENKRVFSQLEDNDQNQFVGDNTYDARGQLKTGKKSQQLETLSEANNQIRQRNALSNEIANANDRAVMAQTSDTSKFTEYDASDEDYEEEDAGTMESNTLRTDYYIRNVTGMPLFFTLTGQDTRLLHNKKQAVLMSTVADDVTGTFVRIGGIRPRQNLSIQVEGFERVDNIDLGNTGKFTINAGVNKKIVYQVKYQRGSKVIIFSSPVLLQNQTEIPLEALVSMDEVKHRFVVLPNRTISVPLQYLAHNAEMRFRPYELGYKWSSMSFFLPNLHPSAHQLPCDLEDHYQVQSSSSSSEDSSSYHHRISPNDFFLYSISIDQDTSQKFADQHIIKIRPPLTLENVLPVDMKYRIFNEQGTAFLEGKLKKGQTIPVHNLRYEQELRCSIFIDGYSWSDKEYISSARRRENSKSINVYDEKKHPLSIRIDNRFDLEGCRRVTFWSSYWLLNRTGLPLLFAYDKKKRTHHAKLVAGQSEEGCAAFSGSSRGQPKEWHVDNFFKGEPLMMSLSSDRLKRLNVFIKAANSKWSSGLAIRSIPQEGAHVQIEEAVATHSDQPPRLYELSLIKSGAKNIYSRTEVITIVPRYVLVNNTDKTLFLRQEGDAREYKLDPYEHAPFHWPHAHKDKLLRFRIDKNKCNWSGAFTIENTDYFTVQMLDEDLPKSYVMRVRIKIEQGVMIVNFVEETNNALYRIENGLPDSIFVQQQSTTSMVLHVPTDKTQSWGWLEPNQPRILDIIFPDKTVYSMKPHKLKEYTPFKYVDEAGEVKDVVIQVLGLGMTRIIRIKPKSDVPNRTEKTGLEEGLEKMKVSLMFQGVGVSVINELPEELLYLTIDGIKAEFVDMTVTRSLEVEIQDCQIDNQTLSTFTPIMMHSNTERPPQFLKFTAVKDNTYDTIQYFRYFSLLMREMWLTLDQELLLKLLSFADYIMADLKNSKKPAEGDIDEIQPLDLAVAEDDHSQMIYNQFFLLNPISANLTFIARKGKVDEVRRSSMTNILLRIPDQILPSVENAPIRLRSLNLKDAYMSKNEMATRLISFLMSQIGDQVIGVVGSLDILGNPINMFGNIGEGVHDFFYEPAKGITLGAKEFGYGLGKGSKSLAKKTVYGVSDATTKITSSVSHGVAALSMDKDYQRKRRAERLGHQPSNALKGLGYGLKDFTTGIVRGITGVVEQPIKGGREEGPKGVAKGVGKGIAGLVVKPVVGTVDLISRTAEGIRNNTQIHEKQVTRKRPPRNFASLDRRTVQLREYNLYEARGQNLLVRVKEDRVRNQQYMFHEIVAHDRVILVSDKMIYFLNSAAEEVIWRTHFTNISRIHIARHMQPPTVTIDTIDARENQRHLPCITVEQAHSIEHKLRIVCHDWQMKHIRDFHPEDEQVMSEA